MSKVSVFNHAWIDLVFEGRNQEYGAYQLRRQDSKTTLIALFSGIGLMVCLVAVPTAINYFIPKQDVASVTPNDPGVIVTLDDFKPPVEEPEPPMPETAPAAAAPPSITPTTELKPIVATSEPVEFTTTTEELNTAPPAATTTAGNGSGTVNIGPSGTVPGGTGTNTTGTVSGPEIIENVVDVMPQFPGGLERFYSEVGKRFRTPENDSETTLKVYVSFVVEKDGSMTNLKVLRDPCNCMGKEALRVLNSIKTKWEPGKKKGVTVRTAYNLPITVNLK
ncbi:energy transducer TonB [Flavobacterium zepuense]|uniref:Energy transducer TonB n=1 Tax=Flavobacterium zepuense TaxID=2593302 RepID=A0A552V3R4_9FLAO|nr:energy transducer TonB [Flavobacterium zepuense]TRW25088.1 energy transducer TonB [Flavobacterium zepuense]